MLLCPQERCLLQTQLQQALQLVEGLEQEKREFNIKMDGYSETFATCQQSITHSHEVHAGCATCNCSHHSGLHAQILM